MASIQWELVVANRTFARLNILDTYGHVSIRHPQNPNQFIMSRSLAPSLVTQADLMTFDLDCEVQNGDTRRAYGEKFIHGAIYQARPEVQAVCHSHTPSLIPFGITEVKLSPVFHMAHLIGKDVPVWDIADEFGDGTSITLRTIEQGHSLARTLGSRRVALMRGHGAVIAAKSVPELTQLGVYLDENARLLTNALLIGGGKVHYLSEKEITNGWAEDGAREKFHRSWEHWCVESGVPKETA